MSLRQWFRRWRSSTWSGWPEKVYQQNLYQQRLASVQQHLTRCLDSVPAGRVCILSVCAGDGRDVIGVLTAHPRRRDVSARLVELDPHSVATGVQSVAAAGLQDVVTFLHADATTYATYQGLTPAEIVLLCGVWGHVPADQRRAVVDALATFCTPGGSLVWTRGIAKGVTRVQEIESLFANSAWEQVGRDITADNNWVVASYRYSGPARTLPASGQIFNFQTGAGAKGQ
jgi:hypothetical protein